MARAAAWLAWLLLVTTLLSAVGAPDRKLSRLDARKWTQDAKKQAASAAKTFLEQRGQSLVVPINVEVFLIGFHGDGGYAHVQDTTQLLHLLSAGLNQHCPHSLETQEELGVCFQINFQVMGSEEIGEEAGILLRKLEAHLKENLKDPFVEQPWMRPRGRATPPGPGGPGFNYSEEYVVDASYMEQHFDAFMENIYGHMGEPDTKGHNWHQRNPIFVINPSKVRINPKGSPQDQQHTVPDFFHEWHDNKYDIAALDREEAGYVYRYSYNGAGEGAAWLSSRNYAVIDVAAGPTQYGPAVSSQGAVAHNSMPALRDVYRGIFNDLQHIGPTLTAQEHGEVVAHHAQQALFEGYLGAAVSSAAMSLFVPDMVTEHLEYAQTILVPVVLLTDYELTEHDYENKLSQDDFMHMNLTHVEQAVARLLDEQQDAVVISAHHELSHHKQIMAALWKARRTVAEQAMEQAEGKGSRVGYHTLSHTSVDPDLLLEELALAADQLTHGLTDAAHALEKQHEHPLEQLRHQGTRVVPVFVFSLMKAPDDIMFTNKEMVVANHDAVLVLQLRQSGAWGGTKDEHFTGHMANGRRVASDSRDVTRHVIAGLAQAIAGVVPPYRRPRPRGHPRGPALFDWRWAVGATPFGPYSAFPGVSEIMQNAARRNLLLSHASAALRAAQHGLDDLDTLVDAHFRGPFAAAGINGDAVDGRRHFLDTVVGTRHGFKTAITPDAVSHLEGTMSQLVGHLEELAVDLYAHDFALADTVISEKMLPAAAQLCQGLEDTISEARAIVACCAARHVSAFGRMMWTLAAAVGGFAVVLAVGVTVAINSGRRKRSSGLQLPTYGLSPYSRPNSRLSSLSSRQASWQL